MNDIIIAFLTDPVNIHNFWATLLTFFSFFGAYLNLKQNKWGFTLWVIADFSWSIYCYELAEYGQFLVFLTYAIFSVWGYIEWNRLSKSTRKTGA